MRIGFSVGSLPRKRATSVAVSPRGVIVMSSAAKPCARSSPARYSANAGTCPSPSTVLKPTERFSISSALAESSGGTAAPRAA